MVLRSACWIINNSIKSRLAYEYLRNHLSTFSYMYTTLLFRGILFRSDYISLILITFTCTVVKMKSVHVFDGENHVFFREFEYLRAFTPTRLQIGTSVEQCHKFFNNFHRKKIQFTVRVRETEEKKTFRLCWTWLDLLKLFSSLKAT